MGRQGQTADVIGSNHVFIFGGWEGKTSLNDLYILDTDKQEWCQLHLSDAPPKRDHVSCMK